MYLLAAGRPSSSAHCAPLPTMQRVQLYPGHHVRRIIHLHQHHWRHQHGACSVLQELNGIMRMPAGCACTTGDQMVTLAALFTLLRLLLVLCGMVCLDRLILTRPSLPPLPQ